MRAWMLAGLLAIGLGGAASAAEIGLVSAIHVSIGPKLAAKARLYGENDLVFLQNELEDDVQGQLEAAGLTGPGGARLELTLVDARAGRPTFKELTDHPGLSFESPRLGGATIEGALTYPDGRSERIAYVWYEDDIWQEVAGSPWSDAEGVFQSFARDLMQGRVFVRGGRG
jgi:hypothetical protein